MARKHWLVLGVLGLVLSAATRVTAAGPAQVDAEGYGGSSIGSWTCGPTARATYAGGGGNTRFYLQDQAPKPVANETETTDEDGGALPPEPRELREEETEAESTPELEPHGFSIGGGGGAESRSFKRIACSQLPCGASDVLPPTRLLGAGRAGFGYDWDYFGLHLGAMAFPY